MNEFVKFFLKRGYLVSPGFLSRLKKDFDRSSFLDLLNNKIRNKEDLVLLNNDLVLANNNLDINWIEFDGSRVLFEKNKESEAYNTFLDIFSYNINDEKKEEIDQILDEIRIEEDVDIVEEDEFGESNVVILKSYKEDSRKREIQDFVTYFRNRYDFLKGVLSGRKELQNVISINRLLSREGSDKGMFL